MYPPAFLDHLRSPRRQGRLPAPTHAGEAEDPACGDRLWIDLEVQDGVVRDARFRVAGCAGAIAVASALVTLLVGRPATPGAVGRDEIEALLGGIPPAKRHALRLAASALAAALDR